MLQVYCKNTGTYRKYPEGTSLLQMLSDFEFEAPYPIISAKVNNVSQGLKFKVYQSKDIEFIDCREPSGMRVYCRSLCFLMCKAALDIFPGCRIYMEHEISNGYFFHLKKADGSPVIQEDIDALKAKMREIVEKDMPFHRYDAQTEKVMKIFSKIGAEEKVRLLETSGQVYMDYYTLGDTPDYYYGRLVPSAGYIKIWDIQSYYSGLLLRIPDYHSPDRLAPFVDQPKTFSTFSESLRWNEYMDLRTVGDVNHACLRGNASELPFKVWASCILPFSSL